MTRRFDTLVQCPHCREWHTAESAFERWLRNNDRLDSRLAGIVRFDCDLLLHKYLVKVDKAGRRDIQALMFVEIKTRMGDPKPAQADTLGLLAQVLNNRRRNVHRAGRGPRATDQTFLAKAKSKRLGRDISLWLLGGHLLQLSGDSPLDSEMMLWNRVHRITTEQLEGLLRFEIDPHAPSKRLDFRRRYSDFRERQRQRDLFIERKDDHENRTGSVDPD